MPDPCERPPIAGAPLSVLLLACNEGAALEEVVAAWIAYLDGLKREYEVIVVDDGSSDDTAARCDALATQHPRARVLHHPDHRGLGAALRTALPAARSPLVFYTTADRQYEPSDLKHAFESIDKVDLVTGIRVSRCVPAWLRRLGALYRILARVLFGLPLEPRRTWLGWSGFGRRWVARWAFGVRVEDAACAFHLFRRSALDRIVIQSDGAFALVEILAKANFLGLWLAETTVTHHTRAKGGILADDLPSRYRAEAWRVFTKPVFGPVPASRPV
jgi:glycosyltransferase involved in cell wall biosynthesis